ncbi:monofunctional biosynthetic peptidoglycan transglycosylase [Moraxella macacae 0408225]|uniref:Biosynthetic peptidoglycan transglycosylase n=1 Tax=Moraxella macacae 0408225 TaxID=1230338 RepID=L2F6N0_9GAMM|nr:monofunctional biosynthetic peptidoglycan transglycosylase [Moraxella macacae]ELA08697.1 monofunctional biosynthetic peptidoglycan transglycosylase [Moraxella macacae 0408225]
MSKSNSDSQMPTKFVVGFNTWLKRLFLGILTVFLALHLMVLALLMIWKTQPINHSMFMILHRISTSNDVKQTWINDDQISINVKRAVIASEDANFANHQGFDIQGIENAIKTNQKAGKISAGGSTISQQLAKNLFLFPQRSYIRKGEEALITLMIEQLWTKERILTAYLNVVEFGNGIYGIEEATQHYFNKPAKRLTKREAASLVAMLPNPKFYQKNRKNQRLNNKTKIILRRMGGADLPD